MASLDSIPGRLPRAGGLGPSLTQGQAERLSALTPVLRGRGGQPDAAHLHQSGAPAHARVGRRGAGRAQLARAPPRRGSRGCRHRTRASAPDAWDRADLRGPHRYPGGRLALARLDRGLRRRIVLLRGGGRERAQARRARARLGRQAPRRPDRAGAGDRLHGRLRRRGPLVVRERARWSGCSAGSPTSGLRTRGPGSSRSTRTTTSACWPTRTLLQGPGDQLRSEYRMLARDGRVLWVRDVATVIVGRGRRAPDAGPDARRDRPQAGRGRRARERAEVPHDR